MEKALIIYHSADPDGWCSAALMHALVTDGRKNGDEPPPDIRLDGYNYDHFPEIGPDVTEVYMGDVSPPPETMKAIVDKVGINNIYWWDHHMSRVHEIYEICEDYRMIDGSRKEGVAGCALILDWMKLRATKLYKTYSKTNVVEFTHLYDTWKHEYREDILSQNAGIRIYADLHPRNGGFVEVWKHIMSMEYDVLKIIRNIGRTAYQTQRSIWDHDAMKGNYVFTYDADGKGMSLFVLNTTNDPSLMFDKETRDKHDCCITWYYHQKKGKYKVSCRSTDGKSALEMATRFGGGGHPNAAGAWVDKGDWGPIARIFGMTP
jgi:oligoribonuclease NrnB/cAMP/cGMP phosphodiesterase (DHH superfamily)